MQTFLRRSAGEHFKLDALTGAARAWLREHGYLQLTARRLRGHTLNALKRLMELVTEGGGQLSIVLVGKSKLKNDLKRPTMEEIGDRTTVFEFGGLRDQQREYIAWVLGKCLPDGANIAA